MEGRHIPYLCLVIFWNIVGSSESYSQPVLVPLETIDGCIDCIVGRDGAGKTVWCDVDETDVNNVTMTVNDETLVPYDTMSGRYIAAVEIETGKHHMAKLTCIVHYNVTQETLAAEADIYVIVETNKPPSLYGLPKKFIEGLTPHISCLKENIRPPANNLTMRIDGMVVEGLEPKHDRDNSTLLYNSYVVLTYFKRTWNRKNITCCQNNAACSDPQTVDFIFRPDNVTLNVEKHSDVARQCYIMNARCYISHANPPCNVTWHTTNGVIAHQSLDNHQNNPKDGSVSSVYSSMIYVNMSVAEVAITCTPVCGSTSFANLSGKSWSTRLGKMSTNETETGSTDSIVNVELIAGIVVGVGVFLVICVFAIVFYKYCKKPKDTDQSPSENIATRDSEEMQERQQPEPHDNNQENKKQKEKQLAYIEVEFDTSGNPSCSSTHINRRESQVNYVAIDLIKTADIATEEEPLPDEAEIYINHEQESMELFQTEPDQSDITPGDNMIVGV